MPNDISLMNVPHIATARAAMSCWQRLRDAATTAGADTGVLTTLDTQVIEAQLAFVRAQLDIVHELWFQCKRIGMSAEAEQALLNADKRLRAEQARLMARQGHQGAQMLVAVIDQNI